MKARKRGLDRVAAGFPSTRGGSACYRGPMSDPDRDDVVPDDDPHRQEPDERDERHEPHERHERDEPHEPASEEPRRSRAGPRLLEQLSGLLDAGGLRRGGEVLGNVTGATKDEVVRIVSAEVRNFLEKMDAVDLAQQVIHGLTVDVNMQIRFSRSVQEGVKSEITRSEASFGSRERGGEEPGEDG